MTTEILGFIIIAGAVIVLAARHQLNKAEDDPEVLEAATGRLRYELEQSADEIISRMTEHVDRLERLLREADYKAEVLQERIRQLEALQPVGGYQSMSAGDVRQGDNGYLAARAAADAAAAMSTLAGSVAAGASRQEAATGSAMPAMSETDRRAWELFREASMELEAQYEAKSNTMQSVQQSDALQQAVDIQAGNLDSYVSSSGHAGEPDEAPGYVYNEESGLDTEAAARQARQMLAQGFQVDEIARATGLGIGAVQLIRQMQSRQSASREKKPD